MPSATHYMFLEKPYASTPPTNSAHKTYARAIHTHHHGAFLSTLHCHLPNAELNRKTTLYALNGIQESCVLRMIPAKATAVQKSGWVRIGCRSSNPKCATDSSSYGEFRAAYYFKRVLRAVSTRTLSFPAHVNRLARADCLPVEVRRFYIRRFALFQRLRVPQSIMHIAIHRYVGARRFSVTLK